MVCVVRILRNFRQVTFGAPENYASCNTLIEYVKGGLVSH